jgi:hypothetical protein
MKLLAEYVEHSLSFDRMAAQEHDREVRAQFEKQAEAYRKLAAERAARYGLSDPSPRQASHHAGVIDIPVPRR